eukprot:c17526_g1_i1 orf=75-284(-)
MKCAPAFRPSSGQHQWLSFSLLTTPQQLLCTQGTLGPEIRKAKLLLVPTKHVRVPKVGPIGNSVLLSRF